MLRQPSPLQHVVDEDLLQRDMVKVCQQRPQTRSVSNMDAWWRAQGQALQMQQLAANSARKWPLLRSLVVVGPSTFVHGEQGGFALLEPDYGSAEVSTGHLQQGLQS